MPHFLLLYDVAPDYLERRGAHRDAHLRLAWAAHERGELLLGGAFAEPADGAALLFRGETAEVAERFARADPYVTNGLVAHWRVRRWTTVVGAHAETPVRPADEAAAPPAPAHAPVRAQALNPILNVSDLQASFAWFARFGWRKAWAWGEPPDFGAVAAGQCEIFLCENGQGGRGRGDGAATFGPDGDTTADRGAWMSVWVDDVDAVHARCVANGVEVAWPPTDMPWGVREMHVRHPDGHVFRVSRAAR